MCGGVLFSSKIGYACEILTFKLKAKYHFGLDKTFYIWKSDKNPCVRMILSGILCQAGLLFCVQHAMSNS